MKEERKGLRRKELKSERKQFSLMPHDKVIFYVDRPIIKKEEQNNYFLRENKLT